MGRTWGLYVRQDCRQVGQFQNLCELWQKDAILIWTRYFMDFFGCAWNIFMVCWTFFILTVCFQKQTPSKYFLFFKAFFSIPLSLEFFLMLLMLDIMSGTNNLYAELVGHVRQNLNKSEMFSKTLDLEFFFEIWYISLPITANCWQKIGTNVNEATWRCREPTCLCLGP